MLELKHGHQVATVSLHGAIINTYKVNGESVLYPRMEVDGSYRGGSHVCLPNFGPDEKTDQPQHGYGRLVDWTLISQTVSDVVLEYTHREGVYSGLSSTLEYTLGEAGLLMNLRLSNSGVGALEVAPGFHPYFSLPSEVQVIDINGELYGVREVEGTEWIHGAERIVARLGQRRVILSSVGLDVAAVWSMHPDRYICIEPTLAGNAHLRRGDRTYLLEASAKLEVSCQISISLQ